MPEITSPAYLPTTTTPIYRHPAHKAKGASTSGLLRVFPANRVAHTIKKQRADSASPSGKRATNGCLNQGIAGSAGKGFERRCGLFSGRCPYLPVQCVPMDYPSAGCQFDAAPAPGQQGVFVAVLGQVFIKTDALEQRFGNDKVVGHKAMPRMLPAKLKRNLFAFGAV